MAWRFSVYLLPTFLSGLVAVALAGYAWHKRDQRAALPFHAMMVGLAIWAFGYGIEIGFTELGPMLWWDQVAFIGSAVVPTAWFLLAVEYAGYETWITRRTLGLLAIEPVATLLLVWTNEAHGLIWQSTSVDVAGPLTTPHLVFGPAYWVNFVYSYALIAAGVVLVASVLVRASRIYRRQGVVLLAGLIVPLGANLAFNVFPWANPLHALDLTPFAFVVTGVFYALALFRFKMLDLAPTARETLVEAMDDGIVVADASGTVVDANPAARRALGEDVVGRSLDATDIGRDGTIDGGLLELSVGDDTSSFELSSRTLTDFRGDTVGRFVLLRDITELEVLREHEQRLSVLNRVLRHNLRNELNVVLGEGELLAESVSPEDAKRVRSILDSADRMLDISEKARHIESTIGRTATETVDLARIVATVADRLAEANPDAAVSVDGPTEAWVGTVGQRQLAVAIINVGENAVQHNPTASATVRFQVEQHTATVELTVVDDGPGIPEMERAAIEQETETPLVHGSGLGLWLVRWVVQASGGELRIETTEEGHNAVTIELERRPRPEESDGDDVDPPEGSEDGGSS